MRLEINGKSTGVGTFEDGIVVTKSGVIIEPDRTENSRTGNHWTHVFKDVSNNVIVIRFGSSTRGRLWRSAFHADGTELSDEEMNVIS